MNEPKRLIEEADSALERAILQAGQYSSDEERRRLKILVSLGVGTAVTATSKSSFATAMTWKNALIAGAVGCAGVVGVVGYQSSQHGRVEPSVTDTASTEIGMAERAVAESVSDRDIVELVGAGSDHRNLGQQPSSTAGSSDAETQPQSERHPVGSRAAAGSRARSSEARKREALGHEHTAGHEAVAHPVNNRAANADEAQESSASRAATERPETHEPSGVNAPVASAAAAPAEPIATPSDLQREVAVLDAARGALAAGRVGDALRHLSDYAKRFPRGRLRLEAEVLRIEVLASSGHAEDASRRARAILERSPNSIVAARLRRFVHD
ncbi:MAG TPA: hypothetical protein VHM70_01700 [Polyangiaceae bacterium]|jgi:TolA-binding protein|nr:hypothetical protein [Polyangiaceae bacterium]